MIDEVPVGIWIPFIPLAVSRWDPQTGKDRTYFVHEGQEYETLEAFYQACPSAKPDAFEEP